MRVRHWKSVVGVATFAALIGASALPTIAQQGGPSGMPMGTMPGEHGPAPGASNGMMDAMQKMNRDMAAQPTTGNTDQDFVAMMIPHHQGAIDMARAELATGKDPEIRKLAEDIIKAQEKEIQQMRDWQRKNSVRK